MVDLLGEREKETQGVQHSGQSGMVRTELDRVVRDCAQSTSCRFGFAQRRHAAAPRHIGGRHVARDELQEAGRSVPFLET